MSEKTKTAKTADSAAVIDIEGIIGVAEDQQFDPSAASVATYKTFKETFEKFKSAGYGEFIVNIRSTGGNVNDALLIHDLLRSSDAQVTTKCFGYVASAATIIAQAASPGCREISENSLYLIHKSACSTEGNAREIAQTIEMLDKTDKRITAIYADRSGKNVADFETLMAENSGNGRWLSPDEAITYGLADKITAAAPIKAEAKSVIANLGLPPIPKKRKNMTAEISKTWNKILRSTGLAHENEEAEPMAEVIDATDLEKATREVTNARSESELQKQKVERARAAAMPTATKPKEDPDIQEIRFSANESAYMEDIKRFTDQ